MKPITRKEAENYFRENDKSWHEIDLPTQDIIITAFQIGHNVGALSGYNEGFEVAQAAERGIIAVNKKIEEYDQATQAPAPSIAANTSNAGAPGPHPIFIPILDSIINGTYKSKP